MAARLLPVDPAAPDPDAIADAARVLVSGGLVAFPTETVYGLGADATNPDGVQGVFAAKGRPADNPLIVHLADAGDLGRVAAAIPALAADLAARFWPGPLTLVVEARAEIAGAAAGLGTVAVRVPDHPVALALLRAAAVPVAAPSANRSGRPSPTTAAHVMADLAHCIDVVLDGGACAVGLESTVVDARGSVPIVLREGAVTREDLGLHSDAARPEDLQRSPGTRHRHYQPACGVEIAAAREGAARASELAAGGRRVGLVARRPADPPVRTLAVFGTAEELGRVLYAALRAGEAASLDVVVVEGVADEGVGRAVMDRLRRAATPDPAPS